MSTHADDAGLHAVARVRGVRESDSRAGLQAALGEHRSARTRVDELRARIEAAHHFAAGSSAEFISFRASLAALGEVLVVAESEREAARTISDAAFTQWQLDRARLSAIEMLLQRRAEVRRAERDRAEVRELDDIAAQRWLRRQTEVPR